MIKKIYSAPKVKKVELTVKNAVLGACQISSNLSFQAASVCDNEFLGCMN